MCTKPVVGWIMEEQYSEEPVKTEQVFNPKGEHSPWVYENQAFQKHCRICLCGSWKICLLAGGKEATDLGSGSLFFPGLFIYKEP